MGNAYVDYLFTLYNGRVPREADLVTYWFEKARAQIEAGQTKRVGLLATQSVRAGANRKVLERIKSSGDIFYAQSDRPWILDGAAVRVSMVGFDDGQEAERIRDDTSVTSINSDLTTSVDLTTAHRLNENLGISYMGDTKGGPFDIGADLALEMINAPINTNGASNTRVVRPWANGQDIAGRPHNKWIIDFGSNMQKEEAACYQLPFEYVEREVKPERRKNNRAAYRDRWWIHVEPRPAMRAALASSPRYITTPRVAKHRLFAWLSTQTLPDSRLYVFARDDDYFFGILHSRVHEVWSLATSSRHGVGNDPTYNNTTCFETFPFPWPPDAEPHGDPLVEAIANAARELVQLRDPWLNPPEPIEGATLRERTLTTLYNRRPDWLDMAHKRLDAAVCAAYGWPVDVEDDAILAHLLRLNGERA